MTPRLAAWLILLAAVPVAAVPATDGGATGKQADPGRDTSATAAVAVEVQPSRVKLGQPFELTVSVAGQAGTWRLPDRLDLAPGTVLDSRQQVEERQGRAFEVFRLRLAIYERLGQVSIPGFTLEAADGRGDTLEVPATQIEVVSVLAGVENPTPRDVAGPVAVLVEDYRPLAVAALALCWLLLAAALWWHRPGPPAATAPLEPLPPELGAEEIARRQIAEILKQELVKQGRYQEYFDRLSDTLREYLGNRFGFFALDLTSRELLEWLRDRPTPGLDLGLLRRLLEEADLVKFARARPDDEMCSRAVDGTLQIIAATTVNPAEGERQ